jgi:hypothetical protein
LVPFLQVLVFKQLKSYIITHISSLLNINNVLSTIISGKSFKNGLILELNKTYVTPKKPCALLTMMTAHGPWSAIKGVKNNRHDDRET